MPWSARCDGPIVLPDGRKLTATHITALLKAEHDAEQWQTAMEALPLVAERGGPTTMSAFRLHHLLSGCLMESSSTADRAQRG